MRLPDMARMFLVLGRVVAFAAAALAIVLMAWQGYDLLRYAFVSEDPTWGEVGVFPFVVALRILLAAWVVRSVVGLGGRALLRVLLVAFGGSFLLLYGWYFLLLGFDDGFFYWVVGSDFLYLAGASVVGCALLLSPAGTRIGNSQA